MSLGADVRHNLTSLASFSGRDSRARFWPYIGLVLVCATLAMIAILLPELFASLARAQKFAIEHPELATIEHGPGSYSISIQGNHPELAPNLGGMMQKMGFLFVVVIALYAAAVVRRLHDRDMTGAWGLLPLPFIAFSTIMMGRLFVQNPLDMQLFFAVFVSNFIYLLSLAVLVVLLAAPGAAGDNRYGPAPQS